MSAEFELLAEAVRVLPGLIKELEEAGAPPLLAELMEARAAFVDGARHLLASPHALSAGLHVFLTRKLEEVET